MQAAAEELSFPPITPPDPQAASAALSRLDAAQIGPTGRLGEVHQWLVACQGFNVSHATPRLVDLEMLIVAADNGAAHHHPAISVLPPDATLSFARAIQGGTSPVNAAAEHAGLPVTVIDAGIRRPGGDMTRVDALSRADLQRFVQHGKDLADTAADKAVDLLIVGDAGRGLTTVASGIIGSLTHREPVEVVGRGSGIGDAGWKQKITVVRDAMFRARGVRGDVPALLQKIGSSDIAVVTGLLAQSAVRHTPVLLDGVGVLAAAMCAQTLAPGASAWWQAASAGTEPAGKIALAALQMKPLVDAGVGMGQGMGALLALPWVHAAAHLQEPLAPSAPVAAPADEDEGA